MSRSRSPILGLGLVLALAEWSAASAQSERPISFAFASQAGTGIYEVEGRLVQIYRLPIAFTAKPIEDGRWGVKITLPITFGFYDYEPEDFLEGELPAHVGVASLLPGVRVDVRVSDPWVVSPYVEAGAAKDFEGDIAQPIYAAGVRSVVSFPWGAWDGRAGQRVLWAGTGTSDDWLSDEYGELEVGFEFRHELPANLWGSRLDIGLFVLHEHYFKEKASPALRSAAPATVPGVDEQNEIGFTFGTRPKLAWWKLAMPKLGLSYRFGDGIWGVRFVIGEVF